VNISPGVGTLLLFDTPVARVELAGRERFARVRLDKDTLTLLPAERLEAEEELLLTIHFADGAAPTRTDFLLVVHATLAERQVEVVRRPRPAEALAAELEEKEAEVRRLRAEIARLQAAQAQPEGLTGLLATRHMHKNGVKARDLSKESVQHPRNVLTVWEIIAYRAEKNVAIRVGLANTRGVEAWKAEGAVLEAKQGTGLRVLRVWQSTPFPAGEEGHLVVEAEATDAMPPGPYTLTVWAEERKRAVIIGNILFP
jgi:uncharacterized protein (TIGR02268 family)